MDDKINWRCRFVVKRAVRKMFGRADEDVEQEIYIRLWQKYPTYHEEQKLTAWVRVVAENYCRDVLKSKSQKLLAKSVSGEEGGMEELSDFINPEKEWLLKCRRRLVLAAVDELPSEMRQAVVLVEFEGLSYEAAAKKLKLNVGTLKSRLYYAKKKLHEKLAYLEI